MKYRVNLKKQKKVTLSGFPDYLAAGLKERQKLRRWKMSKTPLVLIWKPLINLLLIKKLGT